MEKCKYGLMPVSYTHLDVYKRQGIKLNIVSFGGGTNSAALLVGLHQHGIPVDLITFADTGAEQPHTYQFLETMNEWLRAHGMPPITVVEKMDRNGNRLTLETECLRSGTLPSIAYGFKLSLIHISSTRCTARTFPRRFIPLIC